MISMLNLRLFYLPPTAKKADCWVLVLLVTIQGELTIDILYLKVQAQQGKDKKTLYI
jgi:hypothetical protein